MSDLATITQCSLPRDTISYLTSILPNGFLLVYEMPPNPEDGKATILMACVVEPNTALAAIGASVANILNNLR